MKSTSKNSITHFLLPSILGLISYMVIYFIVIFEQALPSLNSYFDGVGIDSFKGNWSYTVAHKLNEFLALKSVGSIAFFGFWLIIGLIVYSIVRVLANDASGFKESLNERHFVWPVGKDRNAPLRKFIERLCFQLVLSIVVFIYVKMILGLYGQWLHSHNGELKINFHETLLYEGLLLFVVVVLHVLVLLVRLLLLRVRIFGDHLSA